MMAGRCEIDEFARRVMNVVFNVAREHGACIVAMREILGVIYDAILRSDKTHEVRNKIMDAIYRTAEMLDVLLKPEQRLDILLFEASARKDMTRCLMLITRRQDYLHIAIIPQPQE